MRGNVEAGVGLLLLAHSGSCISTPNSDLLH